MLKRTFGFLIVVLVLGLKAQNPIVPPGTFMADPSAHVWPDGKLYVYGSRDESVKYYCSHAHDVLTTSDLKTWTFTKNIFSSKGDKDGVPYSNDILYAPDCQYKNGTYYLYYCLATNTLVEGVATAKVPEGPFTNGENINTFGYNQIDPCTFIDDNGTAYYIWGQFNAKMAKLKPDMKSIDSSSIRENVVSEKTHFFHEGAFLFKRKGIYYMTYSHMGRAGMPTCIGYATSKKPFGPYTYKGVIIDNAHCDPGNWNNHGSVIQFKGKWYVFYHRSTHGSRTMRKACLEPITFNADNSINEVEMTTQGAGPPLSAFEKIEAESACLLYGNVRVESTDSIGEGLAKIKDGDETCFKYIDFGNGADSVSIAITRSNLKGEVHFLMDNLWSKSLGSAKLKPTNTGTTQIIHAKINLTEGVHALILKFKAENKTEDAFTIDWIQFYKSTSQKIKQGL